MAVDYRLKRENIVIAIQNDLEMLSFWLDKEFVPLEMLCGSDRQIVVLSGFSNVHDMLEDVRRSLLNRRRSLRKIENKIKKIETEKLS